jgi:NRAMP (natural resistance-associated macrophage protein)-like metal ion transporter
VVTGAADDDPSGIATYSQTGARFGYGQLWMILLMLPMMVAVQEICARIGMVSGRGIAGVVREHYPRPILYTVVGLLLIANTINLGTDLGAMAAATRLIVPLPYLLLTAFFALFSVLMELFVSYRVYARFLKWMSLSLIAYVLTGFIVSHDWVEVLHMTIVPHISLTFEYLMLMVAVLGTTISPYLFFWQASQEVEEEIEKGHVPKERAFLRGEISHENEEREIRDMRIDTWSGMIFSQVAAWFIIVTAAGSLHQAGITDIATAADAAKALDPLVHGFPNAGKIAEGIFALGIIGLGLMAVPIFAGSASYALSETFGWREGLSRKLREAPQFYAVMIISVLTGMAINFFHIDPIRALVYTAVINGVVAVPLILILLLVSSNRSIMGKYTNGLLSKAIGWFTFVVMGAAAVLMFVAWAR